MNVILTGGFLGSGKTTAISKACKHLIDNGKSVAVITNDQGDQQVDTAYIASLGITAREVRNGCFCCHYSDLERHIDELKETVTPDYIFAEAVGSCTDLVATIARPLLAFRDNIRLIISVFIDAEFLCALLENRSSFIEESVRYIYKKQLDEADMLVINKIDLLRTSQLTNIQKLLKNQYPSKVIVCDNSLGNSEHPWLTALEQTQPRKFRPSLDIDYEVYARGEASLAWLDETIYLQSPLNNAVLVATKVMGAIFDRIQQDRLTVGHLKFFTENSFGSSKVSFTSSSTSGNVRIDLAESSVVKIIINARIQGNVNVIRDLINNTITLLSQRYQCKICTEKLAAFVPGYPTPTHRMTDVAL